VNQGSDKCARREVSSYLHGKTQYSLRLGGEYNILLGILAVRAGVSYESNGQDPTNLNITNYQLGRTGLHVGATWRIAGRTDFSVAYAHFIQARVALTVNSRSALRTSEPGKYHVVSGDNDGMARFAIADAFDTAEGPLYANAGTFYYHLDVLSVSLAQHF
jgi:long-subunit fatty acid transport protein